MDQTPLTMEGLAAVLQFAAQHGTALKGFPASTPTALYGHGPGGLFSSPALERPVFSAMMLPRNGLQARLPLRRQESVSPLYGILTGVTATTGSEPTGPCDDFPVAGFAKLCMQTSYFARQGRQTPVFELDRVGQRTDRGEHFDFQIMGNPWNQGSGANVPQFPSIMDIQGAAANELGKLAFQMGAAWSRDFAREFYTGNPINNTAQNGRKYYRGLDALINTGYRDAINGAACAAADSIVASFFNQNVSVSGASAVRVITDIMRRLRIIASGAGLMPVKWAIVMRPNLFYELTEVWPCAYSTYRCQSSGNFSTSQTQVTDTQFLLDMRDRMRGNMDTYTGQYLLIDGAQVEVILDDAITEQSISGVPLVFQSDMYFVPLNVLGGIDVTYMEYFPYNQADGPQAFAESMGVGSFFRTSDDGRFLWHFPPPNNFCVAAKAKTEPRLILRTPYLAARLTNIRYSPLVHERDPFTDSPYWVDGGNTTQPAPSYYTPTA